MSRKKAIDPNEYIRAVKRLNSMSDSKVSVFLRVGRASVWRFRTEPENKPVIDICEKYLAELGDTSISASQMTYDTYLTRPVIVKWREAMEARMVGEQNQKSWMRTFFNMCKHLNVLPSQATVEQMAKVVVEQRNRYYKDEKQIRGFAYSTSREAVRGYFMSVQNVGAMYLTNLGVTKEDLKGVGKYARQRVPQVVRHRYEEMLINEFKESNDYKYLDALGNGIFNHATATRVSASLRLDMQASDIVLLPKKWTFEVFDKGTRGKRLRWSKFLNGNVLEKFKEWASYRFDIPIKNLEDEMPIVKGALFPSFVDNVGKTRDDWLRDISKPYLVKAGLPYADFPPTHIWRHTFAQDMLWATNFNYELVASIGGWINTAILKKHYGKMGEDAREMGFLEAQGIKVEKEKRIFQW